MQESVETKIKAIEEKYNRTKNWILGISAVVIIGSSWHGFRSLNDADQMEFMNPYAGKYTEYLIAKETSKYLDIERKRLYGIETRLNLAKAELDRADIKVSKIYLKELGEFLKEESKFANDDFIEEKTKLKNVALDVDKENEWNRKIRKNRKIGTDLYSLSLLASFIGGVLLAFNVLIKGDKVEKIKKDNPLVDKL